ncbi:DUF2786 domain-containing protein [Corynebacterium nasicanis]|uniref:DUF2786 domain-containing protein n=1 Tax=Corynebacterium nasicanis TaxID=1448267 RepID=A0ABW1QAN8_9CORY
MSAHLPPLSFDDAPSSAPSSTDAYRTALQTLVIDRLVHLAREGWTPDDIRHVLGHTVDPHLRFALRTATMVAPDRVSAIWTRQSRPPAPRTSRSTPLPELESLWDSLSSDLPPLGGTADLIDLAALQNAEGSQALSTEQVRARKRISGLLKKAESTTFAHEAESLVAKAQQLRQRYRIDSLDPDIPDDMVTARLHLSAPWVRFQHLLLSNIAVSNSCRAVLLGNVDISSLVGHPDDVRYTAELFTSLNRQRDYYMRHSPGAADAALRGETAAYRRSFLQTYAYRIGDLLTEATTSTTVSTEEVASALPVLARRSALAEDAFARNFPGSTSLTMGHRFHAPGATDGIHAAERSHLGPERTAVGGA